MKSIDKLRDWARGRKSVVNFREFGSTANLHGLEVIELGNIANEIEAEIARDYMLLPLDAESKTIRVGDVLENFNCPTQDAVRLKVGAVGICSFAAEEDTIARSSENWRHVKPDPLKDLVIKAMQFGYLNDLPQEKWEGKAYELAGEIRELMKAGAE